MLPDNALGVHPLFVSHQRVSGFPEKGSDPRGTSGEVQGTCGEVWENFRGTSGLLLKSTVREVLGKSPRNFWGSSGKLWEAEGLSRSSRSLTPSQRLVTIVSTYHRYRTQPDRTSCFGIIFTTQPKDAIRWSSSNPFQSLNAL